ncbi:putative DNA-binding transcriptional regulator [Mesorhizobium sp. ORS 3324]|nr:putative DNA-binding transcriptional regulator [Mesorhizobium sp. ORS 3324]
MNNFELRRFRYFLAVAEELHFARAAERLHMAQPPLSVQIRKLEEEVGFRVFERTSRNVALTEAGRVLLAGTRNAMDELQRAVYSGQQTERGHLGHVRIGFVSSGGVTFLPKLLRQLSRSLPEVQTQTRQFSSNGALEALAQRNIDLAVVRTPFVGDKLQHRTILRDRVVIVLPDDHPMCRRKRIRLHEMQHEKFVLYPPNEGYAAYSVVQRACLAAGFAPLVAEFVDDVYGMLGLVSAGVGVALMPEAISRLNVDGVVFRPLPEIEERFELSLVWRAEDKRRLISAVVEALAEMGDLLGSRTVGDHRGK